MDNTQIPFFYEFPEGKGGMLRQMERKIHGQLKFFRMKRQSDLIVKSGGRESNISHTNLAFQSEQAGKITPALSPGVRGCPHSPKAAAQLLGCWLFLLFTAV